MAPRRIAWLVILVGLGAASLGAASLGACSFHVDYSEGRFACGAVDPVCPEDQTCVEGFCRARGAVPPPGDDGDDHDDAVEADGGAAALADAGVPEASIDAAAPDAPPPALVTFRLGERNDATTKNVTSDATLDATSPAQTLGNDDDVDADTEPLRRGVLRFDTKGVPVGAQVLSAELTLYVNNPIEDGVVELAPLVESWDEATVSWTFRQGATPWTKAGGTAGAAVATVAPRNEGSVTVPLPPALVQQWVSAPLANYGLRLSSTSTNGKGATFDASESNNATRRPLLVITALVPAP